MYVKWNHHCFVSLAWYSLLTDLYREINKRDQSIVNNIEHCYIEIMCRIIFQMAGNFLQTPLIRDVFQHLVNCTVMILSINTKWNRTSKWSGKYVFKNGGHWLRVGKLCMALVKILACRLCNVQFMHKICLVRLFVVKHSTGTTRRCYFMRNVQQRKVTISSKWQFCVKGVHLRLLHAECSQGFRLN